MDKNRFSRSKESVKLPASLKSRFLINKKKDFTFEIKVEYIPRINNNRSYSGCNRLYNYGRKAFYYLFEEESWTIHTNDHRFKKEILEVASTSRCSNIKFKISSLLTAYFYKQNFIPNRVRHKYYNRIRTLLLEKEKVMDERTKKDLSNNRRTKTYIRFSYKQRSIYLGKFIRCREENCVLPCAVILSQGRQKCADHVKSYYQEIERKSNNIIKGKDKVGNIRTTFANKNIWSNRLGIRYVKHAREKIIANERYQYVKYNSYTPLAKEFNKLQLPRIDRFLRKQKKLGTTGVEIGVENINDL
jgi:hypothetical protein